MVRVRAGVLLVASYLALAVVQSWPLGLHLDTALTGDPAGDTGVYVWNQWVFRHQLVEHRATPFSTDMILPVGGPADLSLHNYTVFADLLALPLQPLVGVVAAFNLIYLINVALAGLGMFVLARRELGRVAPDAIAAPWLAGALFACGPYLVARSLGHFSLAAAAPLPFFVAALDRAWHSGRARDAAATGVCLAWAAFSDPYYGVYCLMLGVIFIAGHIVNITRRSAPAARRVTRLLVDGAIAATAAIVLGVSVLHGGAIQLGRVHLSVRSLYTPMLVLTLLIAARVVMTLRPAIACQWQAWTGRSTRAAALAGLVAALILSPQLYALATLAAHGRVERAPVPWRSSAPGLDLAAYLVPSPMHALAPDALTSWLAREPGWFAENVATLPFVALAVIAAAVLITRQRPSRLWTAVTIGFAWLSLGPFIRIAGYSTFIPTPWALLRYVPIVGDARMPQRFAVVALMGVAVLFAHALAVLVRHAPHRRRWIIAAAGIAIAFELAPVPRVLYSAEIPAIYDTIAADPRPVHVLELPFGVRDGLSSLGDFSAVTQFYQTRHGKAVIGGYKSRVSGKRKAELADLPVLGALIRLSEGRHLSPGAEARAREAAPTFAERRHLGYVVMHTNWVRPELRRFAIDFLGLRFVASDDGHELYVPVTKGQ